MPRYGDGPSDDAIPKAAHNIIYGAGPEQSDHVARADKTAPLSEHEKGLGLESERLYSSAGDISR
ncbi:hypothetical protein N657DRAFT_650405 [Parathielavia appendiculata]|uniref:Uncharacterized protein n=1 Tax=Parathielavia appendiculata TaxID=2587402 RepID=A0AAN6YZD2_9PEZI|nr:hypothetical protein N657DRAFT_650405 [Parathielavia appendiculata]